MNFNDKNRSQRPVNNITETAKTNTLPFLQLLPDRPLDQLLRDELLLRAQRLHGPPLARQPRMLRPPPERHRPQAAGIDAELHRRGHGAAEPAEVRLRIPVKTGTATGFPISEIKNQYFFWCDEVK